MAYNEGSENFAYIKRAVTGITDFSGRSRRTELVCYWIAIVLIALVPNFVFSATLSWKGALLAKTILQFVLTLPTFAQFARRLHDQDRSAWWVLLLIFTDIVSLYLAYRLLMLDLDASSANILPLPLTAAGMVAGLVVLVFVFWPGTPGDNRFGTDPRVGDAALAG